MQYISCLFVCASVCLCVSHLHWPEQVGLGIADYEEWNGAARVWELHVHHEHLRRGIGRALLQQLSELAVARRCRCLWLEAQNWNVRALDFYISQGFEMQGIDVGFYTNSDLSKQDVPPLYSISLFILPLVCQAFDKESY